MIDPPALAALPACHLAVLRLTIPRAEIQLVMGPALQELLGAVAAQGLTPAGPWMSHHLRFPPGQFDLEVAVPVERPIAPAGRVQPGWRTAAPAAHTVLRGDYRGLSDAWQQLDAWARAQDHTPAEALWEVYTRGPEASAEPERWETELWRPLTQAPPELRTRRLRLRPWTEADLGALHAVWSDPRTIWWGHHRTLEETRALLERALRQGGWWAVEREGEVVGNAFLRLAEQPPLRLELGYHLRSDAWGQGLATEAAGALLGTAGGLPVEALVVPDNGRSRRVLEKLGFTPAGEVEHAGRPHQRWRR